MAYLERIRIDAFGRFADKTVGPFSPGLNVVFGRNEAGKSTMSAFVDGVLFGWPEARGGRNTYKPKNAERSGTLFFRDEESGRVSELSRVRNADGLKAVPEQAADLIADVDRDTFRTLFFLTSDELRKLSSTTVADQLLTAGSGTGCSPAEALKQIDDRIWAYTTRASSSDCSIPNLRMQMDDCRMRYASYREEADSLRAEDAEFATLAAELEQLRDRMAGAHAQSDRLARAQAGAAELIRHHAARRADYGRLADDLLQADASLEAYRAQHPDACVLSEVEERSLRDRLSALSQRAEESRRRQEYAQDAYADAYAAEQALLDGEWAVQTSHRLRKERTRNRVVAFVLPAIFLLAALAAFWQGAGASSPALVVAGGVFAAAAVAFGGIGLHLLGRRDRGAGDLDERRRDAHEKTQSARAFLMSCRNRCESDAEELQAFLASTVLAPASGSAAVAFEMLDEAAGMRTARRSHDEDVRRLRRERESCADDLARTEARYLEMFERMGIALADDAAEPDPADLARMDDAADRCNEARNELQSELDAKAKRYGELKHKLEAGLHAKALDQVKLERAQLNTRFEDAQRDLACLMLARQMLTDAVDAWEVKSQPEVYARASELLSLMTDGRWVEVRASEDGGLTVKSAVHEVLEPKNLSLGTSQQLYLAMRMALLMTARDAGRSIPVLADDILVNFDASRRHGAALALKELASMRQVIVFTCHEEVADLLAQVAPGHTLIEL